MQYKRPNRTEINNLELEILHAHGACSMQMQKLANAVQQKTKC